MKLSSEIDMLRLIYTKRKRMQCKLLSLIFVATQCKHWTHLRTHLEAVSLSVQYTRDLSNYSEHWRPVLPLSCVQTERNRTREQKVSLMFVTCSLIFFACSLIFLADALLYVKRPLPDPSCATHPSMNDSVHFTSRENEIINLTIHWTRVHVLSNTKQQIK